MKIEPMPPYYPNFKQKNKLIGKHQFFQKMMYNNTIGVGHALIQAKMRRIVIKIVDD